MRELEELKPDSGDEEDDELLVKKEGGILEGIEVRELPYNSNSEFS